MLEEKSTYPSQNNVHITVIWTIAIFFLLFGYYSCPTNSKCHCSPREHTFKIWNNTAWGSLCLLFCRTESSFLGFLSSTVPWYPSSLVVWVIWASSRDSSLPSSENFGAGTCRAIFSFLVLPYFSQSHLAGITYLCPRKHSPCSSHQLQELFSVLVTLTTHISRSIKTKHMQISLDMFFLPFFFFLKLKEPVFQASFNRYENKQFISFF